MFTAILVALALLAVVLPLCWIARGREVNAERRRRAVAQARLHAQVATVHTDATRRRILGIPPLDYEPTEQDDQKPAPSLFDDIFIGWLEDKLRPTVTKGGSMLPAIKPGSSTSNIVVDDDADIAAKQYRARIDAEAKVGLPVEHELRPGTKDAHRAGCLCDQKLNNDGFGYMNVARDLEHPSVVNPKTGKPVYVYSVGCPLHWPRELHDRLQGKLEDEAVEIDDTALPTANPHSRDPRDIFAPITRR